MLSKPIKYRKHNWLDTNKNIPLFGIQAKLSEDAKWLYCCEGNDPLLFEAEKDRDSKLKELQK